MTAKNTKNDIEKINKMKINSIVQKPFEPIELHQQLQKILEID